MEFRYSQLETQIWSSWGVIWSAGRAREWLSSKEGKSCFFVVKYAYYDINYFLHFKCAVWLHKVHAWYWMTITNTHFQNFFYYPKQKLYPRYTITLSLPSSRPLVISILHPVSMNMIILHIWVYSYQSCPLLYGLFHWAKYPQGSFMV